MDYEPGTLEAKWRERWAESGAHEAEPDPDQDVTFLTVPYPYPSGGMHVGHARTYTVPDVYARYRRLRGDDVLFPIAWHVTGTPIVGAVERLKDGDQDQIHALQEAFGVPPEDLESLETPMGYARYFIEEAESSYKRGMKALGLSIDWRREFTTNDDRYSKFIAWQYETLRDRGFLEKGLHPVNYCTNENQPVTTHDLLEGEEAEFQEFTLIRFEQDGVVYPMATLRPETVRGVTNAFVHPDAEYVRADVDGEPWVVSAAATEKLALQDRTVAVTETFTGEDLVGERVTNPVTGEELLVLPASFVDPDNATGVVMSVPAHSPDDYVALQEAKATADELRSYGIDPAAVRAIEPVPILEIDDYGPIPARDAVEAAGIESTEDPSLGPVTEELYRDEFRGGRLLPEYDQFAGEVIEDVRDRFRAHYREAGAFDTMFEFTEEVVCRCGGDVEVAERETWFLRYNDEEWREKARKAIANMSAVPENTREQYYHTVDWLEEWPCIRNYGMGTRLPWDPEFVIEPLSDSTIYMAYYTIAHRLEGVPPAEMDGAFFDTLFYGEAEDGEAHETALELREEWDHWYPVDVRFSANDLVSNHLTFFLYHHAELFPKPKWPRGITVMGMGLLEGRKMSSSKGHVALPREVIDEYGADTVRFFLLNSAEPWQDFDWRAEAVRSTRNALERFWTRAGEIIAADAPETRPDLERIDRWLLSKLQSTVREVTEAIEQYETRSASQVAFYNFEDHLRWYRRRTNGDRPGARWTRRRVLETRLLLLAPFVPFLANELHERLTEQPADAAEWPDPDPALESQRVEIEEELVEQLTEDVANIVEVTGTDPDVLRIYVAAGWKHRVLEAVVAAATDETDADRAAPDVGAVMTRALAEDDLRERGEAVNEIAQELVDVARGRHAGELAALAAVDEQQLYGEVADFLAAEFDADVRVHGEDALDPADDPDDRAAAAIPLRPAIHLA